MPDRNSLMHVAACQVTIQLFGVNSLKEKRRILKFILARLPKQYNLTVAEVDCNDTWQTAVIAMAAIGNDPGFLHARLEKAVAWIEENRPDVVIEQYSIEFR